MQKIKEVIHLHKFNFSPFEQFEIQKSLYLYNIFIDNISLYYLFILFTLFVLFMLTLRKVGIVPNLTKLLVLNGIYNFVISLFNQHIGVKNSLIFFSLITSLFTFVLISNFLGLFPYGFTITGHLVVTLSLSLSVFIAIVIYGVKLHKFNFLKIFVPSNVPSVLLIFLICIEIISYVIRPFSLAIRLFANMLGGHTLLNIISSFVTYLTGIFFSAAILPFLIILAVLGLEFAIAMIQSYVFVVLLCIYINDVYNMNH
jgi:F-type H+-transporting ATPase subunit a